MLSSRLFTPLGLSPGACTRSAKPWGVTRGFADDATKASEGKGAKATAKAEEEDVGPPLNVIKVELNPLHDGMQVAKLTEWLKPVGSKVKLGDPLCEIETEDAFVEFSCQTNGYLAAQVVPADPDAKVDVGEIIALIVHREDEVGFVQQQLKNHECVESLLEQWRRD